MFIKSAVDTYLGKAASTLQRTGLGFRMILASREWFLHKQYVSGKVQNARLQYSTILMKNGYLGSRSPEEDMGTTTMNHKLGKGQEHQTA